MGDINNLCACGAELATFFAKEVEPRQHSVFAWQYHTLQQQQNEGNGQRNGVEFVVLLKDLVV